MKIFVRRFPAALVFLSSLCLTQLARAQTFATLPFSETFESGVLQSYWVKSGTGPFRGQVTTANGPHGGVYHYTMDGSSQSVNERNELTLGLNLAGYTNVVLSFWRRAFLMRPTVRRQRLLSAAGISTAWPSARMVSTGMKFRACAT